MVVNQLMSMDTASIPVQSRSAVLDIVETEIVTEKEISLIALHVAVCTAGKLNYVYKL